MADIDIDLGRLSRTASTARTLTNEFDDAEGFADDIGELTGHDGLADKIEDFGNDWDVAREELRDGLASVADFMQAIHDTFIDLDDKMANPR